MDMSPHSVITDVTVDLSIGEATAIYQEIEQLFRAANLDGPDAAKAAFPNLHSLYNGFHAYVNDPNSPVIQAL